jgi:hypothetical protein
LTKRTKKTGCSEFVIDISFTGKSVFKKPEEYEEKSISTGTQLEQRPDSEERTVECEINLDQDKK